ncbi:hypothetical protein PanWU01x14_158940 [Parasponia andersonii]|uniref:Uncharacterized protein n=1 Tax=Parasponia andersonii TaxID=3476 RepID=A0A2P5CES5_PARAD|nr:hypothetical protein PanWU01x14_158940 [Parasponia andersonii]
MHACKSHIMFIHEISTFEREAAKQSFPKPRSIFLNWCNWIAKICLLTKFFKGVDHILKPSHKLDQKRSKCGQRQSARALVRLALIDIVPNYVVTITK